MPWNYPQELNWNGSQYGGQMLLLPRLMAFSYPERLNACWEGVVQVSSHTLSVFYDCYKGMIGNSLYSKCSWSESGGHEPHSFGVPSVILSELHRAKSWNRLRGYNWPLMFLFTYESLHFLLKNAPSFPLEELNSSVFIDFFAN